MQVALAHGLLLKVTGITYYMHLISDSYNFQWAYEQPVSYCNLQINSIKVDNQVFNCWPGESVMWYVNKYIVYLCSNNLDVLQVKTEAIY